MNSLVPSSQRLRLIGAVSLILAGGASSALAQAPAPAAAVPSAANVPTYGPPLAGVCIFARDTALQTSQAGAAVNQQLQQLAQNIQANLAPERDAITKENQALAAAKAKLTPAAYEKRAGALQDRAQAFTQTAQTRQTQFTQTRDNAMNQIAAAVTPVLVAAITAHQCSLVLERAGLYGANPAMDLTPEVIQKLNLALPTLSITLAPPPK